MLTARDLLLTVSPSILSEQLTKTKFFIENLQQGRAIKVVPGAKKAIGENIVIDPNLDGYPDRYSNVGISLVPGWVDLDNDSRDPLYSHCIEAGIRLYSGRIDYSFGRASKQCGGKTVATHILVPLKGDIDKRKELLPGAFYIEGEKHDTEFRYLSKSSKPGSTQHSVGPGSAHFNGDQVDTVVWTNLNTTTTAPLYEVDDVIRGVAAGQLIYTIVRHWTVNRHHLGGGAAFLPRAQHLRNALGDGSSENHQRAQEPRRACGLAQSAIAGSLQRGRPRVELTAGWAKGDGAGDEAGALRPARAGATSEAPEAKWQESRSR
jgi:hypothetical protein